MFKSVLVSEDRSGSRSFWGSCESVVPFRCRSSGVGNRHGWSRKSTCRLETSFFKVLGLDTFSIGQFTALDGSYRVVAEEADGVYRSFVLRDGLLVGANVVRTTTLASAIKRAIEARRDFSGILSGRQQVQSIVEGLMSQR